MTLGQWQQEGGGTVREGGMGPRPGNEEEAEGDLELAQGPLLLSSVTFKPLAWQPLRCRGPAGQALEGGG